MGEEIETFFAFVSDTGKYTFIGQTVKYYVTCMYVYKVIRHNLNSNSKARPI